MFRSSHRSSIRGVIVVALFAFCTPAMAMADQAVALAVEEIPLWVGQPEGTESWTGEEISREHEVPAGRIEIKTNVTVPTLTVFRPEAGRANGTAVVVLPGGAFGALAWDLEGTEVARWLAGKGVTAFVLKYRVRPDQLPPGEPLPTDYDGMIRAFRPAWRIAVEDGRQAVRLLRGRADELGIAADRVGMIGFSAGAATTMGVVMDADSSSRPDFAAPIYGMLMDETAVPADAPPIFIVASQEDTTVPPSQSTKMFDLWTEARRPAELHLYAKGAHGFGMRAKDLPVGNWPAVFEAWLGSLGLLEKKQTTPATTAVQGE